jgi:hypothetical protein
MSKKSPNDGWPSKEMTPVVDEAGNLKSLVAEIDADLKRLQHDNQKVAEQTNLPTMLGKCKVCTKGTKVPWWRMAWHYAKSLWVYWRLPSRDRERVREWMKYPSRAPRVPNKPEPYRFWCGKCKKLIKNVQVRGMLGSLDDSKVGARDEVEFGLGFRIRCHGDMVDYDTTVVAAYVQRPCHIVVFETYAQADAIRKFQWQDLE